MFFLQQSKFYPKKSFMSNTKAMLLRYNKGVTWKTINNADKELYFRTSLNIIKIFKIFNQLLWSHYILVTSCQVLFLTSKILLYFNYYALLKKKLRRVPSRKYSMLDGRRKRGFKKNRLYNRLLKRKSLLRSYRRFAFLAKGTLSQVYATTGQPLDTLQEQGLVTFVRSTRKKKVTGKFRRLTRRRIKLKKKHVYLVQNWQSSPINVFFHLNAKSSTLNLFYRKVVNLSRTLQKRKKENKKSLGNKPFKPNKAVLTRKPINYRKSFKFNKATSKDKKNNLIHGKSLKYSPAKTKATKYSHSSTSIKRTNNKLKYRLFNKFPTRFSVALGYRKAHTFFQKSIKHPKAKKTKHGLFSRRLAHLGRTWLKLTLLWAQGTIVLNKPSIGVRMPLKQLIHVKTKHSKGFAFKKAFRRQISCQLPRLYKVFNLKKRYFFFALSCMLSRLVKKRTLLCPAPVLSTGSASLLSYYRNRVDAAIPFFLKKLFFHKDLINTIVCTSLLRNSYLLSFFLARLMEKIPKHTWFFNALNRYVSVFRFYCNAPVSLKIIIKGRVNRKLRKKSVCVLKTQVALSRMHSAVDYSLTHSFTRASVLGVKVWVVSNSRASKVKTFDQKYKTY